MMSWIVRRALFHKPSPVRTWQAVQLSTRHNPGKPPTLPNLEASGNNSRGGILRLKLFERMFDYLSKYEVVLQKLLPTIAFKAYKTFSEGSKKLFKDMTEWANVYGTLSATPDYQSMAAMLTARQLQLYLSLPAELRRVGPVLVVSALPMAQNVVFPLALMFPKVLLSKHFWDDKLKREVMGESIRARHLVYPQIFHRLVVMHKGSSRPDPALRACLGRLANGRHPSPAQILGLTPHFCDDFALVKLSAKHRRWLVRAHENVGFLPTLFPVSKLRLFSNMMLEIDKALARGDGPLDLDELRSQCHARGLNVRTSSTERMRTYLDQWLEVSLQLKPHQASLLLHLPILLGYNFRDKPLKMKQAKETHYYE